MDGVLLAEMFLSVTAALRGMNVVLCLADFSIPALVVTDGPVVWSWHIFCVYVGGGFFRLSDFLSQSKNMQVKANCSFLVDHSVNGYCCPLLYYPPRPPLSPWNGLRVKTDERMFGPEHELYNVLHLWPSNTHTVPHTLFRFTNF